MAPKGLNKKEVKQVSKMIQGSTERKHFTQNSSGTFHTGYFHNIHTIAKGTDNDDRVGNEIKVMNLFHTGVINWSSVDTATTHVRVIFGRAIKSGLALGDMPSVLGPHDTKYVVYSDRLIVRPGTTAENRQTKVVLNRKFSKGLRQIYDDGGNISQGKLFIYLVSNDVFGNSCSYAWRDEMIYTDN